MLVWYALVVTLATLLLQQGWGWWARARDYWRRRGVPHLPPAPLLGSLTFMLSENMGEWLKKVSQQLNTPPYFGIWLFLRPTLVVNSAELARNILVKDYNNFNNRYATGATNDPIGHYSLFFANDPFWSNMRKRLSPFFSTAKLNGVAEVRLQKCKDIVQRLHRNLQNNKTEDLKEVFSDYSTDTVVAAAFGLVENASLTGTSNVKSVTHQFMQYSFLRGAAWTSIFFLPSVTKLFRFKLFPEGATDFFKKIFRKVVEERGGWEQETSAEPRDIMDGLLQIKREAMKNGEEMPEEQLLAQAVILLQGGFESTAICSSYTLMELAYHPEYQEKLYTELMEAKNKLGDADFDSATISELVYLKSAVSESLRKYPAIGFLDRESASDYQVDDKLCITRGTPVFINVFGMHYNPEYFPEPEKFKPERFFPENRHNIKPYTYMPFGEGPRKCIAFRMGLLSVYFLLAYLLLEFEVRPRAGCPRPDHVRLNPRTTLVIPDEKVMVDFLPRKR